MDLLSSFWEDSSELAGSDSSELAGSDSSDRLDLPFSSWEDTSDKLLNCVSSGLDLLSCI